MCKHIVEWKCMKLEKKHLLRKRKPRYLLFSTMVLNIVCFVQFFTLVKSLLLLYDVLLVHYTTEIIYTYIFIMYIYMYILNRHRVLWVVIIIWLRRIFNVAATALSLEKIYDKNPRRRENSMDDKRDVYRFFLLILRTNSIRIGCCYFHFSNRLFSPAWCVYAAW